MKTRIRATVLSAVAALATLGAATVQAQEVTLKVHFFLPATSYANTLFITPWCDKIAKESGGKLKCQIYPAMQLGGTPPQLVDQVKDGVADVAALKAATPGIAALYEEREYAKALREVMLLADKVNAYVDQNKPWELAKQEGQEARLHDACTACIEAFRLLTLQLKPVLPALGLPQQERRARPQLPVTAHVPRDRRLSPRH